MAAKKKRRVVDPAPPRPAQPVAGQAPGEPDPQGVPEPARLAAADLPAPVDAGQVSEGEAPADQAPATGRDKAAGPSRPVVPIVAIGASAGGLEALQEFFSHMPADCGMAFVVITHVRPGRESLMPELLSNVTDMPAVASEENIRVEPNKIIVAKDSLLTIENGELRTFRADDKSDITYHPVDQFFRALAEDQQERAICIVLSGSGNDGSLGLKAIKAAGGMAMVQDPRTAENVIDGVVMTITDIDRTKQAERKAQAGAEYFESIIQTIRHPLLVMDVSMPRLNGVDATRQIHDRLPGTRVISLSMYSEEAVDAAMREAGAVAYVTKTSPPETLVAAIRQYGVAGMQEASR